MDSALGRICASVVSSIDCRMVCEEDLISRAKLNAQNQYVKFSGRDLFTTFAEDGTRREHRQ